MAALSSNFVPDIVVGASIGCLNGWAIAGGCDPAELTGRWLRLHDIGLHRWRMPANLLDGFLDSARMHAWIRDLHASYEPRIAYGVVLTGILRMKPELFTSPGYYLGASRGLLRDLRSPAANAHTRAALHRRWAAAIASAVGRVRNGRH